MLNETELIGIQTVEKLSTQGEKLENTNRNLNEMRKSLKHNQKNINSVKSMFGNVKDFFSGSIKKQKSQPCTSSSPISINNSRTKIDESSISSSPVPPSPRMSLQKKASSYAFEDSMSNNLDSISDNLTKLKGLAQAMNAELDTQEALLDDIVQKSESVEFKMTKQQKSIEKLLKK